MNLQRIYAGCYCDNEASLKILQKSGFIRYPEGDQNEINCFTGKPITQLSFVRTIDNGMNDISNALSKAWEMFDRGDFQGAEDLYLTCYEQIRPSDHENINIALMGLLYAEAFLEKYEEAPEIKIYNGDILFFDKESDVISFFDYELNETFDVSYEKRLFYYDNWTGTTTAWITNKVKIKNNCPREIYLYVNESSSASGSNSYSGKNFNYYFSDKSRENSDDNLEQTFILRECEAELNVYTEEGCQIFGDDLLKTINDIMNVVKIAIPLLLIGLVTYDFATAVFASDDKAINKAKSNAIKRIIIAVVIFFVPTIINLLFNIVNDVWGTKLETCAINSNYNEDN